MEDEVSMDTILSFTDPSITVANRANEATGSRSGAVDMDNRDMSAKAVYATAEQSERLELQQSESKSAYALFCDMLRHSSAKPVIARIREFVIKFPDNLPRMDAAERVHRFLDTIEQSMFADIVVFAADADEEGRKNAIEGMEKFLLSRLHPKVFANDPSDVDEDEKLRKHMIGIAWVQLQHLGVPPVDTSLLPRAIEELKNIDAYKAPRDKLVCVLNACKVITDMLKITYTGGSAVRPLSADDFLPLLIYTVIQANPPRLHSNIEYVAAFRHPDRLGGEEAYYVTTLMSAKEFVKDAGPNTLEIGAEEYRRLYAASLAAARQAKQQSANPAAASVERPRGAAVAPAVSAAPSRAGAAAIDNKENLAGKIAASPKTETNVQEDDDDFERPLFNKRDVAVFQPPPASSSAGHKADDWKNCIWRGCCRVIGKGRDMRIKLIDNSSGQLFAQCIIPGGEHEKWVEPVTDSSRYFVLKVSHGQKHAFLGLGFDDRNDAFDFKCALSDFKNVNVDRDDEASQRSTTRAPAKDLSLKEGQKITIKLKGASQAKTYDVKPQHEGSGAVVALAPPPAASGTQQPRMFGVSTAPEARGTNVGIADDDFGMFQSSNQVCTLQDTKQLHGPADLLDFSDTAVANGVHSKPIDTMGLQVTMHSNLDFDSFDFADSQPVASNSSPAPFNFDAQGVQSSPSSIAGQYSTGNGQQVSSFAYPSTLTAFTQVSATPAVAPDKTQLDPFAECHGSTSSQPSCLQKNADPFDELDIRGLAALQVR